MGEYNQFEQSLSKQFEAFRPEISNDKTWDAIADQIPTKKRNRFAVIYWLTGLAVVGIFIGGYFLMESKQEETLITASDSKATIENKEFTDQANETGSRTNEVIAKQLTAKKETILEDQTLVQEDKKLNSISKEKTSLPISQYTATKTKLNNTKLSTQQAKPSSTVPIFGAITNSTIRLQPENNNANSTSKYPTQFAETKLTKVNEQLPLLSLLTNLQNDLPTDRGLVKIDYPHQSEINLVETKRVKLNHSIGAQLSYFVPFSIYNANANTETGYEALRKENEDALEAIQGQIHYRLNINRNWILQLGLNYWSLQESIKYRNFTEQLVNIDTTVGIIHLPDGSQEFITGQQDFNQKTYTQFKRFNAYKAYSIPIQLGYQMGLGNGFTSTCYVGYEKSLGGTISGYEFNSDLSEYQLDTDIEQRYKDQLSDYALAGARLEKLVGNRLSISLSIDAKYGLNYITNINALIDKQYHFLGISLGSNYHF